MIYIYSFFLIAKITEQVSALGQEDASRRLASTTTTVYRFN
jgi:hypothetical protein